MSEQKPIPVVEGVFHTSGDLGELRSVAVHNDGSVQLGAKGAIFRFADGTAYAIRFSDLKTILKQRSKYQNLM